MLIVILKRRVVFVSAGAEGFFPWEILVCLHRPKVAYSKRQHGPLAFPHRTVAESRQAAASALHSDWDHQKAHTPPVHFRGSALFEAGWLCTRLRAPQQQRAKSSKAVF